MRNFFIGIIEDNAIGFTYKQILNGFLSDYYGFPATTNFNPIYTNEPLIWNIFYFLNNFLDATIVYSLMVILSFLLLFIAGYKLFKFFSDDKVIAASLSLILTFSPYMYYQTQSHLNLSQVWILVLYILSIIKAKRLREFILTGVILSILLLVSTYLGYFALLFTGIYTITKLFVVKGLNLKRLTINMASLFFVFTIISFVTLLPFLTNNLGLFNKGSNVNESMAIPARTYEEFFYFTSRPWYYLLPSIENPWFGGLAQKAISSLQNDWGYWLTTNHFPREHTASYLGYLNLIFALLGVYYLYIKLRELGLLNSNKIPKLIKPTEENFLSNKAINTYTNILILGITGIVLFILTMPPYLTLDLNRIYTPSHMLFGVFPTFRVLARIGILILLIELMFTGLGYLLLLKALKNFRLKYLALIPIIVISLMEFYVPIKLTDVSSAPRVYQYLNQEIDGKTPIVVYPYSKANDTLFWMREHKKPLINPSGYTRLADNFESAKFTSELKTCNGLINARNLGAEYFLLFSNMVEPNDLAFFSDNPLLTLTAEFEEQGAKQNSNKFITIYNKVDSADFSAKIYRLNEVSPTLLSNCQLKEGD